MILYLPRLIHLIGIENPCSKPKWYHHQWFTEKESENYLLHYIHISKLLMNSTKERFNSFFYAYLVKLRLFNKRYFGNK